VATEEPDPSRDQASQQEEGERGEERGEESGGRQHPGHEEPDPGEREHATAHLLAIDWPIGWSRPRHQKPLTS
jgi:hypothetical protein